MDSLTWYLIPTTWTHYTNTIHETMTAICYSGQRVYNEKDANLNSYHNSKGLKLLSLNPNSLPINKDLWLHAVIFTILGA